MENVYTAGWVGPWQMMILLLIPVGIFCAIFFPIRAAKKRKKQNRIEKDDNVLI